MGAIFAKTPLLRTGSVVWSAQKTNDSFYRDSRKSRFCPSVRVFPLKVWMGNGEGEEEEWYPPGSPEQEQEEGLNEGTKEKKER